MDPFRSRILLVLKARAINLSPTLADASVGVAWHVASVRCQVAVGSGEWQVSGVRWRCACVSECACACECACASANVHVHVHVHVHVYVYVHVKNSGFDDYYYYLVLCPASIVPSLCCAEPILCIVPSRYCAALILCRANAAASQ